MRTRRHTIPRWFAGLVLVSVTFAPFARDLHAYWHEHGQDDAHEISAASASPAINEAEPVQHCDLCKLLAQRMVAVIVEQESASIVDDSNSRVFVEFRAITRTSTPYRSRGPPLVH